MDPTWIGLAVVAVLVVAIVWWKSRGTTDATAIAAAAAAAATLEATTAGSDYVTWGYHENSPTAPLIQCPAGKNLNVLSAFYGTASKGSACGFREVTAQANTALAGQNSHQFASVGTELGSYAGGAPVDPCVGTVKRYTGVAACS